MTHSDLHVAVRTLLRGTPHQSFQIMVVSSEQHPGRLAIEYVVNIGGIGRQFRSGDPKRLLAWVRSAIKVQVEIDEEPPALLRSIGAAPRLRRVK